MSKILGTIKKELRLAFHLHKFEEDDLNDIERQFYGNAHYNNTIFDNSTYKTSAFGNYYCQICCPPNHVISVNYSLELGGCNPKTKDVIDAWLSRHSAKKIDYIIPQTLIHVTSRRGVEKRTPMCHEFIAPRSNNVKEA